MSTRPGRPLVVAGALLLAIVGATVLAERVLGAPRREVELLAAFLSASGILSLVVGALAIRWAGRRIPSLHVRLTLAYGIGLVVALVNVVTTSVLMFLSAHDLALLSLLLVFAAVISVVAALAFAGNERVALHVKMASTTWRTPLASSTSSVIACTIATSQARLGVTSIVITHDMPSVFAVADRVYVMERGEIVHESMVSAFRDDHTLQRRYLGV